MEPRPSISADPWLVREPAFDPTFVDCQETIFALGNGYLGLRGNFEEGLYNGIVGTYVNGFFEEVPIVYPEPAYGYARNRQVMLNVADVKPMRLFVNDEVFDLRTGTIESYERTLDLRSATLCRDVRWVSPAGVSVHLKTNRLVSLARREIAALQLRVKVDRAARIRVESLVDATPTNQTTEDDPRFGTRLDGRPLTPVHWAADDSGAGVVVQQTRNSGGRVAVAVEHAWSGMPDPPTTRGEASDSGVRCSFATEPVPGEWTTVTKFAAYTTTTASTPVASTDGQKAWLIERSRQAAAAARRVGFEALLAEQKAELEQFWAVADVEIDGDEALQQGIRFNLLSLLQSAPRDGNTSICAKGLTGEGYEGHYFWDTETYAVPFFTHACPAIARSLLQFRLRTMDKARARARELGHAGVLFPWRTIAGEETSPYFPAGTAQYHINADIAFALGEYLETTGDHRLLSEGGAELLFETARFWMSLGAFIPDRDGPFCINEVTGPDEYTALVNNNLYTNLMAQWNLRYACSTARRLAAEDPAEFAALAPEIRPTEAELEEWTRAADRMRIPYDRDLGIHAQDDCFLSRARWDFENTPPENYPLLLHYHPLNVYRHQVLKQPDVVLAQVLLPDAFTLADKRRNFAYYDALTTGDSSLSPCIQSIAAAQLGETEKAYGYFIRTARMDLDNVGGNTAAGLHVAAMAGTWMSLAHGFAGMKRRGDRLAFEPSLPEHITALRMRVLMLGRLIGLTFSHLEARYELLTGEPIDVEHRGKVVRLEPGRPVAMDLRPVLEGVVFDLDGVIANSAEFHYLAWKKLADELGWPFDRTVNENLKGVGRLDSLGIILDHAGVAMDAAERERLADRKNEYFREMIETITPDDLLPGICDLMVELRAHGKKIAIASVSHNVWRIVDRLGIRPLVDAIVDPATLVKGKPDPEIFLRAAEMIDVPVANCAGIEDARAGIEAIKAHGMYAVGVGRDLPGADWRVDDTSELTYEKLVDRFDQPRDTVESREALSSLN